ncbi:hypothetical protein M422DRAFT_252947 [Sphaerobolus stellatus SS14]|uniref:Uncharacterized protein n=1 Tax=Sphaerobolus stellatus (strain SS14) TaxID=990650 RepID=A0A0C9UKU7_SPHS4|nr:hypothetical protein M422DRAFT_252947 [Sphaerobolus stellatus SS14]
MPIRRWLHNALSEPIKPECIPFPRLHRIAPLRRSRQRRLCISAQSQSYDDALKLPTPLPTVPWTMPTEKLRGGFRYLAIVATGSEAISIRVRL